MFNRQDKQAMTQFKRMRRALQQEDPDQEETMTDLFRRHDGREDEPAREEMPMAPEVTGPLPGGEDVQSVIDRHSSFNGKYISTRNLRVEGQIEGEIDCKGRLIVAEGARVKARVVAQDLTVAGALEGEVTCHGRLQILPTGRVKGSITAARLAIQEGAYYEGELHMAQEPKPAQEPKVRSAAGAPSPAESPAKEAEEAEAKEAKPATPNGSPLDRAGAPSPQRELQSPRR